MGVSRKKKKIFELVGKSSKPKMGGNWPGKERAVWTRGQKGGRPGGTLNTQKLIDLVNVVFKVKGEKKEKPKKKKRKWP